jgi:outer membrane protein OmpA-like peptidoglycan-associated protein
VTIPVSPDALGNASRITGGVRVTFGPGAADLNPTTEAALRSTARTIGADPASTFNVYAYAAGTAEDPSTPRRLSLSRALAARAVLMSEGIASTRIYVRALGATPSDGPNDRVDVTQAGIAPSPS